MSNSDTWYELWYSSEGVSITEYQEGESEPETVEEWWFTWTEVFTELTSINEHSPEIHADSI